MTVAARSALELVHEQGPALDGLPFAAESGQVLGLSGIPGMGLTRIGLQLLAPRSQHGMVAVLDVRGWFSPVAAWEVGIDPERIVIVRCPDRTVWPQVAGALIEGMRATLAEVPAGIPEAALRRLGALVRSRRSSLVLRPMHDELPSGLTHLRLQVDAIDWEGADAGHGRLERRRIRLRAAGKAMRGREQIIEVHDDGTDVVRVVSGLASAPAGRAI